MGPQEHAFRSGVDVIVATPGRLLDHFRFPYAQLDGLEILVLDEADRMLDMGFLPDIRRVLKHLPAKRQTLFFSATMPPPIVTLTREMLNNPFTVNLERNALPAVGITQAVYPVSAEPEVAAPRRAAEARRHQERPRLHAHEAPRQPPRRVARQATASPASGSTATAARRSARRRSRASRTGRFQVLVATDIAARGIDVEALSHVVNFDVPHVPEDYIHRVGRTARAELTGDAFTFVSPDEETRPARRSSTRSASACRASPSPGSTTRRRPRRSSRSRSPSAIAAIRARKAADRARAKEKAERRARAMQPARAAGHSAGPRGPSASASAHARPASGHRPPANVHRGPASSSRGPAGPGRPQYGR